MLQDLLRVRSENARTETSGRTFRARLFCRALTVIVLLAVLCAAFLFPVRADRAQAQELLDGILAYRCAENGVEDAQAWLDRTLAGKAGYAGEWAAIALSQYGTYDFTAYKQALLAYLSENTVSSASTRQKIALALCAAGGREEPYIAAVMDDSIGEQGIMSLIFGLHLFNNGFLSNSSTADEVVAELLEKQCEDGGWSLSGQYGDVDVTAMTLCALSVHTDRADVSEAVGRALTLLSQRQTEFGDYASYGVRNPESVAQVLTALSALGIDCTKDERFIKNGKTLFDGLAIYRLSDGSYCHKEGEAANNMATEQTFYALVAYLRMLDRRSPLFVLDAAAEPENEIPEEPTAVLPTTDGETASTAEQTPAPEPAQKPAPEPTPAAEPKKPGVPAYKFWAIGGVLLAAAAACTVLILLKKRNYKNFIFIALIALALIAVVIFTNFESAEGYRENVEEHTGSAVKVTVRCDTVAGEKDEKYTPKNGVILEETAVGIDEGDTVYDVLLYLSKKYGLSFEVTGAGELTYVRGINYLYEFDFGDLSGWVYRVNGETPSGGCAACKLKNGDTVAWLYTKDLGNDV